MTALIHGFSYEVSGKERSAEVTSNEKNLHTHPRLQISKILLSQLPEISRHPYVSSAWFCQMASTCLHRNQSLASGRLLPEGETALDTLVQSQCLGSGLSIADGNRM